MPTSNNGPSQHNHLHHNPSPNEPSPILLARDGLRESTNTPSLGMEGDQVQNNNIEPMLLSTTSDGGSEQGPSEHGPEHMVVYSLEANQSSPSGTPVPGDAKCRVTLTG